MSNNNSVQHRVWPVVGARESKLLRAMAFVTNRSMSDLIREGIHLTKDAMTHEERVEVDRLCAVK